MGDASVAAAVATVISALVAAGFGYATQRAKAAADKQQPVLVARAEIEQRAFDRAEAYYRNAMHEQDSDLAEVRAMLRDAKADIRDAKAEAGDQLKALALRVKALEAERVDDHAAIRTLREQLQDRDDKIAVLSRRFSEGEPN